MAPRTPVSSLPADLQQRVYRAFPGAHSVSYDGEFVYNIGLTRGDRFSGTARIRTSPDGIELAEEIGAHVGKMAEINKVWADVQNGLHDSTQGLRPHAVFVDRDGDISVSYPSGKDWIGWERKVR